MCPGRKLTARPLAGKGRFLHWEAGRAVLATTPTHMSPPGADSAGPNGGHGRRAMHGPLVEGTGGTAGHGQTRGHGHARTVAYPTARAREREGVRPAFAPE